MLAIEVAYNSEGRYFAIYRNCVEVAGARDYYDAGIAAMQIEDQECE